MAFEEIWDFSELIDEFGVPITYWPKTGEVSVNDKGKINHANAAGITVEEVFLATDSTATLPIMLANLSGGQVEVYDARWISLVPDLETGTKVEHNGVSYTISNITPYSDYTNVTIYELKGKGR